MSKLNETLIIQLIFTRNAQRYILFSLSSSNYEYLYIYHMKKPIRSLFYGENIQGLISTLLKETQSDCIECSLAPKMIGGGISKFSIICLLKNAILS
ncbi:MAG: hypothetical protein P8Y23_15560 [Candidatus Lokiarchaeota archaeon]